MFTMLCNAWDKFSMWVTDEWSQTTYIIVMSVLGVCGLLLFLAFFKESFDKGKRPKWLKLIGSLLLFGLLALFSAARFA